MKTPRIHFFLVLLVLICFGWVTNVRAAGDDPGVVEAILKKAKEVFEPSNPSLRKVVITLKSSETQTAQWTAAGAMKMLPDGGKGMLLVLLEPNYTKGVAYLAIERKDQPNDMFIYLPSVRRVREIISDEQFDRFLGSDFTYSDLGFIRQHKNYRLVGTEKLGGVESYKLEETIPGAPSYYSKILLWISKESLLPLQREFYDAAGRLWKVETFDDVTVISGVPTPMRITMKDVRNNTSTELKLSEVQYCGSLDDILFDAKNLSEVSANPIWQPYCSLPGTGAGETKSEEPTAAPEK